MQNDNWCPNNAPNGSLNWAPSYSASRVAVSTPEASLKRDFNQQLQAFLDDFEKLETSRAA